MRIASNILDSKWNLEPPNTISKGEKEGREKKREEDRKKRKEERIIERKERKREKLVSICIQFSKKKLNILADMLKISKSGCGRYSYKSPL